MPVSVSLTGLGGSLAIKAVENTPGKDENTYFSSKYVSQFSYTSSFLVSVSQHKYKPKCVLFLTPNFDHLKRNSKEKEDDSL